MNNLIEAVRNYVTLFLSENLSDELSFHNIGHTYEVADAVREIGLQAHLSEEEMRIVQVSAWFHDCGYANAYIGHEEESKELAKSFLDSSGCDKGFTEAVLQCIDSTKYPPKPSSLLEKVICDADMYHLTKANYRKYDKAIRKEFEIYLGLVYTDEEWQMKNYRFLTEHQYYTDYGREILSRFKAVNIQLYQNI
ncbi:HD domain-containing protein [Chryseobacterium oranimense]|uniref:HD domain-containing protein n=1 Tax=Chryseobacterium oranimense TaxID=421058 RepID=UPI0021AFFAF9|nr:HD domain-containing protein [Chryseobacterium oranimense]UWX61786.1 HD domain-containing protein [Chryseobacterium oranimense]